jgi:hypothetical protein
MEARTQTMDCHTYSSYAARRALFARLGSMALALATLVCLSTSRLIATDAVPVGPFNGVTIRDVSIQELPVLKATDPQLPALAPVAPIAPSEASIVESDSQLWMVSTRHLSTADACQGRFDPQFARYDCQGGWTKSSWQEFAAVDQPGLVTTIFIDGNGADEERADRDGRLAYKLFAQSGCSQQPTRFVIWSWPADRVRGGLKYDASVKACRTSVEGYFLAQFLDRIDPDSRVSLFGYSFGARVTTGALHVLGGGDLDGRRLNHVHPAQRLSMHAVLLAAALDDDWLLPGHRNGNALAPIDRMLITVNNCDRVLHFYPVLSCGPEALGYTGVASSSQLGADREKILQIDINSFVGKRHYIHEVFESPALVTLFRNVLLFEEPQMRQAAVPAK